MVYNKYMNNQTYHTNSSAGLMGREDLPELCQAIIDRIPLDQLLSFKRLLDVGCGYGGISKAYVRRVEPFIGLDEALSRIWLIDSHIACVNRCRRFHFKNVIHADFLSWNPNMNFDVVIGNPPYGSGASLAVKFLNKSFELADEIYFVLPGSIEKPSLLNRVDTGFDTVHNEKLPNDTFPRNIQAVYQHWSKTATPRQKIKTLRTHPDLKFVSREEANVGIGRVGNGGAGYVMLEKFSHLSPNSNYFLKVSDATIDRLKQMQPEFIAATLENFNSNPSLSKHQLISIYESFFS